MKTGWLRTVTVLAVLASSARADDKQEVILQALRDHADSIVTVEFECKQTDGKGANKFTVTGVVIDAEGLVMVTTVSQVDPPIGGPHQKPEEFEIIFGKDIKAKATFLGKDEELNLALLKIKKEEPKEGEQVPVLKPLELKKTAALGQAEEILILDRLSKSSDYKPTYELMRVTAVVEKPAGPPEYLVTGSLSAGCPVVNMKGEAIGFVGREAVERPADSGGQTVTFQGRTFRVGGGRARPASPRILLGSDLAEFLADPSKFLRRKCWLGVRGLQALTKDLAKEFGVDEKGGVLLGEVLEQSPAARAGLRDGDILRRIDGERVTIDDDKDLEKFTKRIQRATAGATVVFEVLRAGKDGLEKAEVPVAMEEEPTQEYEVQDWEEKLFALRVKPITRDFLDREHLPLETTGVRVSQVESAGWAQLAGLRAGDIIHGVVLKKVTNLEEFKAIMAQVIQDEDEEVCFNAIRGGKNLFLCVRPQWELKRKD
ncbi:MAG: PDZ domain-containing protein [Planctomycetes bacterium]|nr:PDZ domain-containing protein [Planctomycetota bacterium]